MSLWEPIDSKLFRVNGGDDGARTRDLCRDRPSENRNLLKSGVMDGSLSALRNPWERLSCP